MFHRIKLRDKWIQFDPNSMNWVSDNDITPFAAPEFQHRFQGAGGPPRYIVLNITHACNLACKYCFVKNTYADQQGNMSIETALSALKLMGEIRKGEHIGLSFFGGEPLLNWPLIQVVSDTLDLLGRATGCRISRHVTTNGTLLTDDKCAFLQKHGFSLIVSLDGPEPLHNALRLQTDGKGSYDAVMRGLGVLSRYKVLAARTTLRGTFTGEAIYLQERVAFLNSVANAFGISGVSVEPASIGCRSTCIDDASLRIGPEHTSLLKAEYDNLADWYIAQIQGGIVPRFMHFAKIAGRIINKERAASECGAGNRYMTVNPDGEIHACHREGNVIGTLSGGIDEALRCPWLENRRYLRDTCGTCWARNVCGGGCRKDNWDNFEDLHQNNRMACFIRKLWIRNAIHIIDSIGMEKARAIYGKGQPCKK